MPDRILLIEDDAQLGKQTADRLERAGYAVDWQKSAEHIPLAAAPAGSFGYQLVVLDLMLPGKYGLDFLKELREVSEVPVLVLSARNDSADKVRALKLGADDYMTKPYWPDELVERVKARLRRPGLARTDRVVVGGLSIDLDARAVELDGTPIELTRVELELLLALARRPGVAVSRAWLAEHVLENEGDNAARTLDVHASRLRKKLGRAELIETVWGVGYRLVRPS